MQFLEYNFINELEMGLDFFDTCRQGPLDRSKTECLETGAVRYPPHSLVYCQCLHVGGPFLINDCEFELACISCCNCNGTRIGCTVERRYTSRIFCGHGAVDHSAFAAVNQGRMFADGKHILQAVSTRENSEVCLLRAQYYTLARGEELGL